MAVIRATALTGYPALVTELGGDPDALLRRAGISPDTIGRFDCFVTYLALIDAVESAAHATDTADFGRRLALSQGIEILGPVGVAGRTSATVAESVRIFEQYISAYSPAIAVELRTLPGQQASFLEFKVLIDHPPPHPQVIELSLGVVLRVLRFLLGSGYAPTLVHLPHEPLTSRDGYLRYFACTPRFGERRAGFAIPAADLDHALVHDTSAHRAILDFLDTVIDRTEPGMSSPVRELTRKLLPTGAATQQVLARQFRIHPKTLQRRLAAEGTSFAALVDDVRRDTVRAYLRDTDMSLSHMARELGYAEQSVLTRACRRWFGSTPAVLRQELRSQPSGAEINSY
jgi:AraC-like DNA-binding protein